MINHKIRQGLTIPLAGEARPVVETAASPVTVALRIADVIGMKFKLIVNEGDPVKLGQPLCYPRQFPSVLFRAPAAGVISEIRRGDRRALQEIVIKPDESQGEDTFRIYSLSDIDHTDPDELRRHLLAGGVWPLIHQRPLAKIAHPESQPVAVFINAMATAPLAGKPHILLQDREDDLRTGVKVLSRFCAGKTYVAVEKGGPAVPGVDALVDVEVHAFDGAHPAGCAGVHIRRIKPLKRGQIAWTVNAVDAADIGYLFRTGRFPVERVVAVVGSAVKKPAYYRTCSGADLATLLKGQVDDTESLRYINGDVLCGSMTSQSAHLGFSQSTITVIPEGTKRDFMGWGMPGFSRYSAFRTFASALLPRRKHALDTRLNGGSRPIISIGQWEKVFPFDIHLSYLLRAILAGDMQEAEELGLLELSEEDVALCAFVDPSKTEVCDILRRGLDAYEAENV